jgi:hypothetical protein
VKPLNANAVATQSNGFHHPSRSTAWEIIADNQLIEKGTFDELANASSYEELQKLFEQN